MRARRYLRHIWTRHIFSRWTENKLLSRKFLMVAVFTVTAVGLDIAGRALHEATLTFVRDVVIAFVGVQGAIDFYRYRTQGTEQAVLVNDAPAEMIDKEVPE